MSRNSLSAEDLATLATAIDTLIPAESDHPGGWEGGVEAFVSQEWNGLLIWAHEPLAEALPALREGRALADLEPTQLDALIRLGHEGFYGAPHLADPPGWHVVGFAPLPEGVTSHDAAPLPSISLASAAESYDTVVVGAGTGGCAAAAVLAEAGERVLLLERARDHAAGELRDDHLRGKRAALYTPIAGPDPDEQRVVERADGEERTVGPDDLAWGLNAMTVGGGTRLWQAQAWRFLPQDFEMASTYGVPEGSTLVDWPFDYGEMEHWYELAESEIGVCGDADYLRHYRPQARDFPMPQLAEDRRGRVMRESAERLGWRSGPLSFAINSVPRDGRPACVRCMQCVGHSCPVDAKNGTHNTLLRRAIDRGSSLDLVPNARVLRIDSHGATARGVQVVDGITDRVISADRIIVAAGAAESPRLLLWSGIGNDHVGRHLQNHSYTLAFGLHYEELGAWTGPGHAAATLDFNHDNPGIVGGGVVHDGTQFLPVAAAGLMPLMFGVPRFGSGHTEFMRHGIHRMTSTMACGQQIPSESARVSLDPSVRDRLGVPVVRFSGAPHPEDAPMHEFLADRCVEWLEASGCSQIIDPGAGIRSSWQEGVTAGEHGAGTCRMGDDPAASATDRWGRVHGTDNVYVCDASLHPTNAGLNPGLTVVANALRIGHHLAAE